MCVVGNVDSPKKESLKMCDLLIKGHYATVAVEFAVSRKSMAMASWLHTVAAA